MQLILEIFWCDVYVYWDIYSLIPLKNKITYVDGCYVRSIVIWLQGARFLKHERHTTAISSDSWCICKFENNIKNEEIMSSMMIKNSAYWSDLLMERKDQLDQLEKKAWQKTIKLFGPMDVWNIEHFIGHCHQSFHTRYIQLGANISDFD